MAFYPLALPPGIYRNGTAYQSMGRWYDSNLVRFYQGAILPHGGWRAKTTDALTGKGRAIISWNDNAGSTSWIVVGTESNLYAISRSGAVSDITPTVFTPGRASAVTSGGYGAGLYGAGTYGTPRPDSTNVLAASMFSMDTWGEDWIGVMAEDGVINEWALDTGTPAAPVTNAPSCSALVVTQEGILMALAAENVGRRAKWSDLRDNTQWTPDATNEAGDFDLQTSGRLMMGRRITAGVLLWTDLDLHLATYTGDNRIYKFDKVSDGCGAISRNAGVALDSRAVWMGDSGFWLYNGYAEPLPCDVWDYVFDDLNYLQKSKITCELNSTFGEVTWRYPSGGSTEIDRYVTWNFRENHWQIGEIVRLCGVDKGVTGYPLRVGDDGIVYEHEVGFMYGDDLMPFIEGGPIQMGNGDSVFYANLLMPDDKTVGDVSATFKIKFEPDGDETSFGPYSLTKRTDLRFGGRQLSARFDGVREADWRIGTPRLDVTQGGAR